MITIEDYMEGFEVDELTRTVMLYIESVKHGRRFFESARRVGRKKPIVLLKGGQTRAGKPGGRQSYRRHGLRQPGVRCRLPAGGHRQGGSTHGIAGPVGGLFVPAPSPGQPHAPS
jgi:hypothetical protein